MTFGVVLLSSALLAAAPGPGPGSRVWTVVAVDPKGDARDSSLADAAQLSYRYDDPAGMLWFRVSMFGGLNADSFGVTIGVDTGAAQSEKANWWGANKEFAFDRLITVSVTRTGGRYAGTLGISDAAGAMRREFANLRRDNVEVRVEGDAILIGVRRDELTDRMAMKAFAAVGSNDAWNDDIPNARSAEIDLGAPRPARGLREIDVSRNNLTFPAGHRVLRETASARVARSGHGRTAMILIPGLYSSKDVFDRFVSRNGSRYTFHLITPPGLAGTQPREMPPATTSYGAFTWTRRLARDIRELIEGVRYRPVMARYKVYIVDEVHMLSRSAFNALLKTLEEPPEHVKFIFATTEIRKVPVTVLSRCQRFDLRRVEAKTLTQHFAAIAAKEGVAIEPTAAALVARAADGSVRDGLSLLDQAIALSGNTVSEAQVRAMLGLADRTQAFDLFEAAMRGDAAAALSSFATLYASGADPALILQDLLELAHWVTRLKLAPSAAEDPTIPEAERVRGGTLAMHLSVPVLARAWRLMFVRVSCAMRSTSLSVAASRGR